MPAPFIIPANDLESTFPNVELALLEPNGLLAIGGNLSPHKLLGAYQQGIFPWYNNGQPILWWSPDPRLVLYPDKLYLSRRLTRRIRKKEFNISFDQAFQQVITQCSSPRINQPETWLTDEMRDAYVQLHNMGWAHSVEAWQDNKLVGGLYGIAMGQVFFGESMFAHQTDASKVAFAHLVERLKQKQFKLIDCQVETPHLLSLGAENIKRSDFIALIANLTVQNLDNRNWTHFE